MTPDVIQLTGRFRDSFGTTPEGLARAPGRVNLIGEHTDYNGLPVLPMAIDRAVVIAFRRRPDRRIVLHNLDSRFPPVEFELSESILPDPPGAWGNYPRAAAQALWREAGPLAGLEGVVGSSVPVAAGLSSSSALVVATAIALLHADQVRVDRLQLAELLARGERYVGLQGGGMDQAVSLCAHAGHALRIAFQPALAVTTTSLPSDWRVVIASTMVEAAKSAGVRDAYNTRVQECREALAQVAAAEPMRWVRKQPGNYADLVAELDADAAVQLAEGTLSGTFLRRFRHVVSEGERVDAAVEAMRTADLQRFGELLRASHASLRDDYEVSSPELDELVALAEGAGAAGARLTGAGFGGCIVAAVRADAAVPVMDAVWNGYHAPRGVAAGRRDEVVFLATAASGAGVDPLPEPET